MSLSDTIITGMNNPDCAFYVGSFIGNYSTGKLILAGMFLMIVYKFVDKMALEPSIKWIKSKAKVRK